MELNILDIPWQPSPRVRGLSVHDALVEAMQPFVGLPNTPALRHQIEATIRYVARDYTPRDLLVWVNGENTTLNITARDKQDWEDYKARLEEYIKTLGETDGNSNQSS